MTKWVANAPYDRERVVGRRHEYWRELKPEIPVVKEEPVLIENPVCHVSALPLHNPICGSDNFVLELLIGLKALATLSPDDPHVCKACVEKAPLLMLAESDL